jgi:hypothetical protein
MIEKIIILSGTVREIRLHEEKATAAAQYSVHLSKAVCHLLPSQKMLIDITGKDGI